MGHRITSSMKIEIHQIYYQAEQRAHLDPRFKPYDNGGKSYPRNFEYAVFFELYKTANWRLIDLLGTVSWKFKAKTGLQGADFLKFIEEHPGYDVYFVNPFPELAIYKNVWEQGQIYHQEIVNLAKHILPQVGLPETLLTQEVPPRLTAYCNYWVGNQKFWDAYIAYLTPLWQGLEANTLSLPPEFGASADPNIKAPYAPFIFERMFSTFLATQLATDISTQHADELGTDISTNPLKVISMPIRKDHRKVFKYISPLWNAVQRLTSANSHTDVRRLDTCLVWCYVIVSLWRGYKIPLFLRRLGIR